MNVFYNTIVFVEDMARSRHFYEALLGLRVEIDYEVLVIYENRLALHEGNRLLKTIYGTEVARHDFAHRNLDIYLESDTLSETQDSLVAAGVEFIHPIQKQAWGQLVLRCYDPDGHIVEIGEPLHLEDLKRTSATSSRS